MIKYRYALDSLDRLVDIQSLARDTITKDEKFYTVDFKQQLIPRLGLIKVKHFALKPNTEALGNPETYLHALGKKVFKREYLESLEYRNRLAIARSSLNDSKWTALGYISENQ